MSIVEKKIILKVPHPVAMEEGYTKGNGEGAPPFTVEGYY